MLTAYSALGHIQSPAPRLLDGADKKEGLAEDYPKPRGELVRSVWNKTRLLSFLNYFFPSTILSLLSSNRLPTNATSIAFRPTSKIHVVTSARPQERSGQSLFLFPIHCSSSFLNLSNFLFPAILILFLPSLCSPSVTQGLGSASRSQKASIPSCHVPLDHP